MSTRKINFYLNTLCAPSGAPDYQGLLAQAGKWTRMQQIFMEIAPPQLAKLCALGQFSGGNLTIFAGNGAIAAKLKQSLPSLLSKFHQRGYEVTAIRIAVQANFPIDNMGNLPDKKLKIGQGGVESLHQLAAELPESPLKTAVESLLQRQTGQTQRKKA